MEFALTDVQASLKREALTRRHELRARLLARTRPRGELSLGVRQRLRQAGWMGAIIPEEYGGMGLADRGRGHAARVGASGAGMSGASAVHFYVFPPQPVCATARRR